MKVKKIYSLLLCNFLTVIYNPYRNLLNTNIQMHQIIVILQQYLMIFRLNETVEYQFKCIIKS